MGKQQTNKVWKVEVERCAVHVAAVGRVYRRKYAHSLEEKLR